MKVFIIHAHTANRGDESAVKAMVDELLDWNPKLEITISINGKTRYPNMNPTIKQIDMFPKPGSFFSKISYYLTIASKGRIALSKDSRNFIKSIKRCDLVIHAPGGPSIGDTYEKAENFYLQRLNLVRCLNKPYMFYALSMGPFENTGRNEERKFILSKAKKIILRDPISASYVKSFMPELDVECALDSALQHDINVEQNKQKFNRYVELASFINSFKHCVGITITDLRWHPKHKFNPIIENIRKAFQAFIESLINKGYGVIFIPQLYGTGNDTSIMNEYMVDGKTFMLDAFNEEHDSYFQQYVISQLHAVVGMRYHSNIFSAKMGTPFVSVAYEQKMSGFMQSIGLSDYCLNFEELSYDTLSSKFDYLETNYDDYKSKLINLHDYMQKESHKSTDAVIKILEGK